MTPAIKLLSRFFTRPSAPALQPIGSFDLTGPGPIVDQRIDEANNALAVCNERADRVFA